MDPNDPNAAQDPNVPQDPNAPQEQQPEMDPTQEQGPDGQRRFKDHEGAVWQAEHPGQQPPMAKADNGEEVSYYAADLGGWPNG